MNSRVLPKVENEIRRYQGEHKGERPLYVVMTSDEADNLMNELRESKGYDPGTMVTEFDGTRIVKHPALKPGEIQLTNELPETGS
jgi:hypothetical protein